MGWFSNLNLDSLDNLFLVQLQELYDAELRLIDALPKMVEGARSTELKHALEHHLEETRDHVSRLEWIFEGMDVAPIRWTCEAMKGLVSEGGTILGARGDDFVRDAAIIAAAQRVEHYEMAGYGTVRTWAEQLGLSNAADVLQLTLDEEKNANNMLTEIAEHSVNERAPTQ